MVVRIGYDLFHEVRTILTLGQPPANASMPSVDLHIALLRDLIVEWAGPLVEIPPVPDGHRLIGVFERLASRAGRQAAPQGRGEITWPITR